MSDSERFYSFFLKVAPVCRKYREKALLLLFTALLITIIISDRRRTESLFWPGWYVLKIPAGTDGTQVDSILQKAGVNGFLSSTNTQLSYMAIPGMAEVDISDLDKVLLPGDPRRDPYLSQVHEIFTSGDSSLVYLPSDRSILSYRKILKETDGTSGWQIMDYQGGVAGLIPMIVFLAVALISVFSSHRGAFSALRFVGVLPMALFLLHGPPESVFPALLMYLFSPGYFRKSSLQSGLSLRSLYVPMIYVGFCVSVVSLFLISSKTDYIALVLATVSSELIYFLPGAVYKINYPARGSRAFRKPLFSFRRKSDHQLFEPLSLMQPVHKSSYFSFKTAAAVITAACVVLSFFLPSFIPERVLDSPMPHAASAGVGFDNFTSLYKLTENRNEKNLPDIAMLLSSAAYQEGFLFGAEFRLPMPGESLTVKDYEETENDTISVIDHTVRKYDEFWFSTVLNRELGRGVGRLYASLGGPAEVISVLQVPGIEETYPNRIQIVLYIIGIVVMLVLLFFPVREESQVRSIYKPVLSARRRARAA